MGRMKFVQQLRATAAALEPLTESATPGAAIWDGKDYVKQVGRRDVDPDALAWWSTLTAIAALLEAQDSPINGAQREFLRGMLFGGMGSLSDLYFDSKASGTRADAVKRLLDRRRRELHESLTEM